LEIGGHFVKKPKNHKIFMNETRARRGSKERKSIVNVGDDDKRASSIQRIKKIRETNPERVKTYLPRCHKEIHQERRKKKKSTQ